MEPGFVPQMNRELDRAGRMDEGASSSLVQCFQVKKVWRRGSGRGWFFSSPHSVSADAAAGPRALDGTIVGKLFIADEAGLARDR